MCIGQSNIHGLGDANLLTTLAAIYVSCYRGILSGVVIQFPVHCICFRLVILMSLYVNPPLSDLAVCTCLTIITATKFTNCPACIYRTSGTGLCLSEPRRGTPHTIGRTTKCSRDPKTRRAFLSFGTNYHLLPLQPHSPLSLLA